MATIPFDQDSKGRQVARAVNEGLHASIGEVPCVTACTHQLGHGWTMLGVSSVLRRRIEAIEKEDG